MSHLPSQDEKKRNVRFCQSWAANKRERKKNAQRRTIFEWKEKYNKIEREKILRSERGRKERKQEKEMRCDKSALPKKTTRRRWRRSKRKRKRRKRKRSGQELVLFERFGC